jgi:hypothetical protein
MTQDKCRRRHELILCVIQILISLSRWLERISDCPHVEIVSLWHCANAFVTAGLPLSGRVWRRQHYSPGLPQPLLERLCLHLVSLCFECLTESSHFITEIVAVSNHHARNVSWRKYIHAVDNAFRGTSEEAADWGTVHVTGIMKRRNEAILLIRKHIGKR